MNVRNLTLALALGLCAPLLSQPAPVLDEKVRQLAAAKVAAGVYPGLVIGVVSGGRQEIAGFGSAADDRKREPDGNTVYEIGSVTKTLTALLLADAVERGEATLDQPVQQLLPDYTIPKSGDRAITLLDLATQTSGLPRLPDNLLPKDPTNPYADNTPLRLKEFLATCRLSRTPGEGYEYSNLGFGLLGQALAARAHLPYEELMKKRIAVPLGMPDTAIALSPGMAERFAPGHDAAGKPAPAWDLGALQGAGAIRSTARDLLAYVAVHLRKGDGPLSKALSAVTRPERPTEDARRRIGLAWQIDSRRGPAIVWHNGMTGGYASFVGFTADGERGVVVLTNVSRDVGEIAFEALLPDSKATAPRRERTLPPQALAEYVGRYRLSPGFDLVVSAADGGLSAQATGQPSIAIFNSAPDEFFYKVVDAQLTFERDAAGKIKGVILHQNGRDMPAPRVEGVAATPKPAPREIPLAAPALLQYVGTYSLVPGFALLVTSEGGQLYVQATGQPRVPVFASAPDEFFFKVVDAQLSFLRASDGSVRSVTLHQNGRDLNGAKQAP